MLRVRINGLQGSLYSWQAKVLCRVVFASQDLSWVEVPPAVACDLGKLKCHAVSFLLVKIWAESFQLSSALLEAEASC